MSIFIAVVDPLTGEHFESVEVSSDDFATFREGLDRLLEESFPTLMAFNTWDGVWGAQKAAVLERELAEIEKRLSAMVLGQW